MTGVFREAACTCARIKCSVISTLKTTKNRGQGSRSQPSTHQMFSSNINTAVHHIAWLKCSEFAFSTYSKSHHTKTSHIQLHHSSVAKYDAFRLYIPVTLVKQKFLKEPKVETGFGGVF